MGLAEELPVYKKSYDCKPQLITLTNNGELIFGQDEEMGTLGECFLNLLVLNQDLQDFEDQRGRLRFKRKGFRRGLLYMLLFADA